MDKNTSVLIFDNYQFNKMNFTINKNFKETDQINLIPSFSVKHIFNETKDTVSVILHLEIFDIEFKDNSPFFIELEIEGFFSVNLENDTTVQDSDILNILKVNTISILFPYLRAALTSLTATVNIEPIVLPIVNVNRMLEK